MHFIFILLALCFQLGAQTTLFKDKAYLASGLDTTLSYSTSKNAVQLVAPCIIYSKAFNLNDAGTGVTGNWGIVVQPDSAGYAAASDSDADTMIFFPEYWGGTSVGWIPGDTMQFHTRVDSALTGGYADTTTFIIDVAGDGITYFWQAAPADSFSIHAFPIQRVRVKAKVIDATVATTEHFGLKSEILIDIR